MAYKNGQDLLVHHLPRLMNMNSVKCCWAQCLAAIPIASIVSYCVCFTMGYKHICSHPKILAPRTVGKLSYLWDQVYTAGLLSALYTRNGEIVANPDPASGLYITKCDGHPVKAPIPEDHIAFQMGEAMQVDSLCQTQPRPGMAWQVVC